MEAATEHTAVINVSVPPALRRRLRIVAAEKGTTMRALLRSAIWAVVEEADRRRTSPAEEHGR